jgi:hypothetical protein
LSPATASPIERVVVEKALAAKVVVKTLPAMFSMKSLPPLLVARNSGRPCRLMRLASARATLASVSPATTV